MCEAVMAPSQLIQRLSLVVFLTPAIAYRSFQPNCTIPDTAVNIVFSPGVRGTYDILWSCLFTLLVCTWTIQHLNIPKQTPDCTTWSQSLKDNIERVWGRLKWMLLTLILPEFLVGKALQDFARAREFSRVIQEIARADGVRWTMTHSFYADMGGFVYRLVDSDKQRGSGTLAGTTTSPELVGFHHASADKDDELDIIARAIQSSQPRQERDKSKQQGKDHVVYICKNTESLVQMRRYGAIQRLPEIKEKEIWDKSKGDAFVKGIALVQVVWLIVQVISRAAKSLPISQLEIAVLAYSACAVLTYVLLWYKPQNVGTPTYAKEPLRGIGHRFTSQAYTWFLYTLPLPGSGLVDDSSTIPNDALYPYRPFGATMGYFSYLCTGLVIGGTIFGALHCLAWGFQFPSQLDTVLWRVSAIICTVSLPAYHACFLRWVFFETNSGGIRDCLEDSCGLLAKGLMACLMLAYVFARFCLLVLVFRSLFYLPPEAFLSTWSWQVPRD